MDAAAEIYSEQSVGMTTTLGKPIQLYLGEKRRSGALSAKSIRSIRYRLASLDRSFGNRPMEHLTLPALRRWEESIGELRPATRAAYLASVNTFCKWLVEKRWLKANACGSLVRPKVPRTVPRAQSRDACVKAWEACANERERTIFALEYVLGMRACEVARASVDDYDPQARTMLIHGKGQHEREVAVPEALARRLDALTAELCRGPLVPSRHGGHLTPDYVGSLMVEVCKRAGIKRRAWDGVSGHAFRATAASDLLDAVGDGDLRVIQEFLGHLQLSTTSIYLRRAGLEKQRGAQDRRVFGTAA